LISSADGRRVGVQVPFQSRARMSADSATTSKKEGSDETAKPRWEA
jgi:hypothetical protein